MNYEYEYEDDDGFHVYWLWQLDKRWKAMEGKAPQSHCFFQEPVPQGLQTVIPGAAANAT